MTLLHNFRTAFLVVALLGGCGSSTQPQMPSQADDDDDGEDDDDDDSPNTTRDAGKDAGKKDAGKKDAGSSGEDDEGDDDDDDEPSDAGKDAGKGDAGKDAGKSDGGASDAGRSDAGRSDAGSSAACTNLTYEAFGKNFVDSYCALCHNMASAQNGNVALTSLANIVARKELVKNVVLTEQMPPLGIFAAPSESERERFGAFIDCGPR